MHNDINIVGYIDNSGVVDGIWHVDIDVSSVVDMDDASSLLNVGLISGVGGDYHLTGVGGIAIIPLNELIASLRVDTNGCCRALTVSASTGSGTVRCRDTDGVLR